MSTSNGWWRGFETLRRQVPSSVTVLLVAAATGACTGAVVALFKTSMGATSDFLYGDAFSGRLSPLLGPLNLVVVPTVGGLAVSALRWRFGQFQGGIDQGLAAIEKREPLDVGKPVVKTAAAVATLGTGCSLGPEGPAVEIGASVGRSLPEALERWLALRLPVDRLKLLFACGAAAGAMGRARIRHVGVQHRGGLDPVGVLDERAVGACRFGRSAGTRAAVIRFAQPAHRTAAVSGVGCAGRRRQRRFQMDAATRPAGVCGRTVKPRAAADAAGRRWRGEWRRGVGVPAGALFRVRRVERPFGGCAVQCAVAGEFVVAQAAHDLLQSGEWPGGRHLRAGAFRRRQFGRSVLQAGGGLGHLAHLLRLQDAGVGAGSVDYRHATHCRAAGVRHDRYGGGAGGHLSRPADGIPVVVRADA
eukprot:ctg_840.g192